MWSWPFLRENGVDLLENHGVLAERLACVSRRIFRLWLQTTRKVTFQVEGSDNRGDTAAFIDY